MFMFQFEMFIIKKSILQRCSRFSFKISVIKNPSYKDVHISVCKFIIKNPSYKAVHVSVWNVYYKKSILQRCSRFSLKCLLYKKSILQRCSRFSLKCLLYKKSILQRCSRFSLKMFIILKIHLTKMFTFQFEMFIITNPSYKDVHVSVWNVYYKKSILQRCSRFSLKCLL